jgi:hypothetical protein
MDRLRLDSMGEDGAADELSAEQRARLEALEATVVRPLRTASVPDLTADVMARVAASTRRASTVGRLTAAVQRPLAWLWTPRPFLVRPAYALAVSSIVFVLAVVASSRSPLEEQLDSRATMAAPVAPQVYVQFRLEIREASRVTLAGSFTDWKPVYELRESTPGTWSILLPLHPGVYDYAFVVDGQEWVADPHAFQIDDGFGGVNSRIALPSLPAGRGDGPDRRRGRAACGWSGACPYGHGTGRRGAQPGRPGRGRRRAGSRHQ